MPQARHAALVLAAGLLGAGCCHEDKPPALPEAPAAKVRIGRVESGLWSLKPPSGLPLGREPIGARMAFYQVPGVSVAVIHDYAVEWARSYGTRVRGGAQPVDAGTVFQAASVSKPVTALAVMALAQRGVFALDDDVNRRLVSWRIPENGLMSEHRVTPRELMSHNAGVTVHGFNGYAEGLPVPTLFQVLTGSPPANSPAIVVDLVPGSAQRYSGGGYCVLQQLIGDVTGKPFPDLMSDVVLGPLGMTRSTFMQPLPEELQKDAAIGHVAGRAIQGRWHTYPEMAAAGLWTTPVDLARFVTELQRADSGRGGKVLDGAWAHEMLRAQSKNSALGVFLQGKEATRRFMHNGSNAGYQSLFIGYPNGDGAVVLTNADTGGELAEEIMRAIAVEYGWPGYVPAGAAPPGSVAAGPPS